MIEEVSNDAGEAFRPIFFAEFDITALAHDGRRDLSPDVPQRLLRNPDIRRNHLEDFFDQVAALIELKGRDDEALLEYIASVSCNAAGRTATYIDLVPESTGYRDHLIAKEYRSENHDVGMVGAASIGMVQHHHVLRIESEMLTHPARRVRECSLMRGHVVRL